MNGKQTAIAATLMLTGIAAAMADEVTPAWQLDDFILEEIVVSAEAPTSFYMEEVVVTAVAPAHLYMEEVVVVAKPPAILYDVVNAATAIEPQLASTAASAEPVDVESVQSAVMEEIVVSVQLDALPNRVAMRPRNSCNQWHF